MRLRINGEDAEIKVNTVADVLMHYSLDAKRVVVELNKEIVKKEFYSKKDIKEGDRIEIVTIVGGG